MPHYSNNILQLLYSNQANTRACPLSHTADCATRELNLVLQLDNGDTIKSMTDGRSVYQVEKWGQANKRNGLES